MRRERRSGGVEGVREFLFKRSTTPVTVTPCKVVKGVSRASCPPLPKK